jgi:Uma2 family endonuclease
MPASALRAALEENCPREFAVLLRPIDVQPDGQPSCRAELVMVRPDRATDDPPVLIVEVADGRAPDPGRLAATGVEHYWHFDPAGPEFVAYRLVGAGYVEVVRATGDERIGLHRPVLVEICPAELAR